VDAAGQYWAAVAIGAALGIAACVTARRHPGPGAAAIGKCIAVVLATAAILFVVRPAFAGTWTARSSLPLDLCDVALVIAAITTWRPSWRLGVELTYFWGMAGTLQAVATPDLTTPFPDLEFFLFVVGHLGIVIAAMYLVVGLRIEPRRGSVARIFAITAAYTGAVALVDWATGANYMYLARAPGQPTLLSVLGPWPWYLLSAAGVALVLFTILDAPFRLRDRAPRGTRVSRTSLLRGR
jgi:hypothetical integral membrane protein (TIGR02206 family)